MKLNHKCKTYSPKIGVVIPARNEAKHITKTINAILNQTLPPTQVVVVDDNSSDDTAKVVARLGVDVISFPYDHENWVIKKELAHVFNLGLMSLENDLDYAVIVGADDILPDNYFEYITSKMHHDDVVLASGKVGNEDVLVPRGSGRIVDWKWWKSIGGVYPVNYGYESWLIAKCISQGKTAKVYHEIRTTLQRPTGKHYATKRFIHRGHAYKALGYNRRFVICRFVIHVLKYRQPLEAVRMVWGYTVSSVTPYEDDVRSYYRTQQNHDTSIRNIQNMFRRFRDI